MEKINTKNLALILISMLLYDIAFVDIKYNSESRALYSLFPPVFYQIALSEGVVSNNTCYVFGGCEISDVPGLIPVCSCDLDCIEYDDCCHDAPLTGTRTSGRNLHDKKEFMACQDGLFIEEKFGLQMVSKCPSSYAVSGVSDKCAIDEVQHPVTADDGTIYRNSYCAYCHNVSRYAIWQFEYDYRGRCTSLQSANTTIPDKMKSLIENKCRYEFIPSSNTKFRACFNITTENEAESTLCSGFQNPLLVNDKVYKNIYCVPPETKLKVCVVPEYTNRNRILKADESKKGIFDFYPALDLFRSKRCHDDKYYYDKNSDTCLPSTCMERQTDTCFGEFVRNHIWSKYLEFVTDGIADRDFIFRLSTFVYLSLPIETYNITMGTTKSVHSCGTNTTDGIKSCCLGVVLMEFKNEVRLRKETILKIEVGIKEMKWQYQETRNNSTITAIDTSGNKNLRDTCAPGEKKERVHINGNAFDTISSVLVFAQSTTTKRPKMIPKQIRGVVVVSNEINETQSELEKGDVPKLKTASVQIPKMRFEQFDLQYSQSNETVLGNTDEEEENGVSSVGTTFTTYVKGVFHVASVSICFGFMKILGH